MLKMSNQTKDDKWTLCVQWEFFLFNNNYEEWEPPYLFLSFASYDETGLQIAINMAANVTNFSSLAAKICLVVTLAGFFMI